ncbi:hypothetical protein RUND412_008656 [Rhizina undulata]
MSNIERSFQPNAELDSDAEEDYVFIGADLTIVASSSVEDPSKMAQRTESNSEPSVDNTEQTIDQDSIVAGYINSYIPLPPPIYHYSRPNFIVQDALSVEAADGDTYNHIPLPQGHIPAVYSYPRPISIDPGTISDPPSLELDAVNTEALETWDFDISESSANVMDMVSSAYENSLQPVERTAEDEECAICIARKAVVKRNRGNERIQRTQMDSEDAIDISNPPVFELDAVDTEITLETTNVMNVVSSAHEDSLQPVERTVEDEECTICVARIAIVQFGQCKKCPRTCYTCTRRLWEGRKNSANPNPEWFPCPFCRGEVRTVEITSRALPPREVLVGELGGDIVLN